VEAQTRTRLQVSVGVTHEKNYQQGPEWIHGVRRAALRRELVYRVAVGEGGGRGPLSSWG
jgi:hypothetical protein